MKGYDGYARAPKNKLQHLFAVIQYFFQMVIMVQRYKWQTTLEFLWVNSQHDAQFSSNFVLIIRGQIVLIQYLV